MLSGVACGVLLEYESVRLGSCVKSVLLLNQNLNIESRETITAPEFGWH